jgi:uncharacterized integral membrane protein
LASALLVLFRMNVKTLFKTVFSTAVLVMLLLMGMHNRTNVDFSLLPVSDQRLHGPVALMYFAFFGVGVLTGMVVSIRTSRKQTPPSPGPTSAPAPTAPRIGTGTEPRIGSRIS